MSLSVMQLGANAFEREFVECIVVQCPFLTGSTNEKLWRDGYNQMDIYIQNSMTPLVIN
jgi:hypothetical protein